jgi:phosphoserine phosphatase
VALVIFDLDNTLIAGDSDHAWGEYLVEHKIVDAKYYKKKNDQFFQDYQSGQLIIEDYLAFALEPLAKRIDRKTPKKR